MIRPCMHSLAPAAVVWTAAMLQGCAGIQSNVIKEQQKIESLAHRSAIAVETSKISGTDAVNPWSFFEFANWVKLCWSLATTTSVTVVPG